jgi:hypothetical protein
MQYPASRFQLTRPAYPNHVFLPPPTYLLPPSPQSAYKRHISRTGQYSTIIPTRVTSHHCEATSSANNASRLSPRQTLRSHSPHPPTHARPCLVPHTIPQTQAQAQPRESNDKDTHSLNQAWQAGIHPTTRHHSPLGVLSLTLSSLGMISLRFRHVAQSHRIRPSSRTYYMLCVRSDLSSHINGERGEQSQLRCLRACIPCA